MNGNTDRVGDSGPETLSGRSSFVPDADAEQTAQRVTVTDASEIDAFIFCSDGIEDPFYPAETMLQAIFRQLREGVREALPGFAEQRSHGPIIDRPKARKRLAMWLKFEKKGENDDRTIIILHRSPSAISLEIEDEENRRVPT